MTVAAGFLIVVTFLLPGQADDAHLNELLTKHFRARTVPQQREIQDEIVKIKGLDCTKLAAAIRNLQLWEPREPGEHEATLRLGYDESSDMKVLLRVPPKYDPAEQWPLIITLHGHADSAENMLDLTRRIVGSRIDEFIIAAPQDIGPLSLTFDTKVVQRPRALLNALRREFHIDSDRVFLMGYSEGSHNAWIATLMHADCFAGVVPLATPVQTVGGDLLYEILLANMLNTPILFCWGSDDRLDLEGKPHPLGGNAYYARRMRDAFEKLKAKHFLGIELENVGHLGVNPPDDYLMKLLDKKRTRFPERVHQVFRLPDQSDAYWVAANTLAGTPLPSTTLHIEVEDGEDPIEAQRKWIADRLGLITARCKGQRIKLHGHRAPRIILLLSDELIDLDKPIMIQRGKRKSYKGRIKRDMRVMLTEAVKGWDFDRLYSARAIVPAAGKVKFGYPD